MTEEQRQYWYFSFNLDHPFFAGHYVTFYGTYAEAREEMLEYFGKKWAFQYSSAEKLGVGRWNLKKLERLSH